MVKKYVMDESLSWEDRYHQLEKHHIAETTELVDKLQSAPEAFRERVLSYLHEHAGRCSFCGSASCGHRRKASTLPATLSTDDVIAALKEAAGDQ